jgi:hypothetical protein
MRIETWKSDKGDEEIHHFIAGTNTYLFGFNRKLLGDDIYQFVRTLIEGRPKPEIKDRVDKLHELSEV